MKKLIALLVRFVPRKYLQRVSGPAMKMAGVLMRGNGVECPICGKHFKKFLPYGRIHPRPNALCPNCLSLERHRLIWLYLRETTNFFDGKKSVLHVAPEACFMPKLNQLHKEQYITADIESPLAKVKMDIHHMPFRDETFDVVLCNHVLEHVQDDIAAMKEIYRVLKPGGYAILQVPFFHPIPEKTFSDPTIQDRKTREKLFGQDDHVRRYGKDFSERIRQAGLNAIEDDFASKLPPDTILRFGLVKEETIFKGVKEV